ncbi:MAG: aldehyde dehydrogenase [Candidatus Cryptobacteroides sp.]
MTEQIVAEQREFFLSGKTLNPDFRIKYLKKLKANILAMESEIEEALGADLGKSRTESYMCEVGLTLSEAGHAIRNTKKWSRRKRVSTPLAQFPARSYIIPEPYGNVLIMSPWNYPFLLCMSPLVCAISAGNTAIVKPSAYSPATSAVIRKLVEATFPPEYVTVIEGGRDVNSDLLEQKFDYIFFTGSKGVGKLVMEKAAAHLTPVTLELGGKSPVIVDRTADLKVAAARIVFGKYLNCGQTCVAPDYVLVEESILGDFLRECVKQKDKMYGENALSNPDYGKIVNSKHFTRLAGVIGECSEHIRTTGKGALVCGGGCNAATMKIEPTIISLGSMEDEAVGELGIMREEIFGPIMPVLTYTDISQVKAYINARPRPLATYIFTSDSKTKEDLLASLHFGGGCVNDTVIHLATESMPFGGVGESGMGGYHGKFGFDTFTHLKSIVDKPFWLDLPLRYQPFSNWKDRLIRMFVK